jgi:hypothetical protein
MRAVRTGLVTILTFSTMIAASVLAPPVSAQDVGEIALVPDNNGILQSVGFPTARYLERTSCAFLTTHADQYDAMFVWTSERLNGFTRTQQGWATVVPARGIGRDGYPVRQSNYCTTRLRQAVKMADIDSFSDNPDDVYTGAIDFSLSGVELMGHEFGHHWLAAVRYMFADQIPHCTNRGFTSPAEVPMNQDCDGYRNSDFNSHWSYYFNTGSVMYGNTIADLGGGMFELTNPSVKYSPLDQYLMGLRDPQDVPPMFMLDTGDLFTWSSGYPIERGTSQVVSGDRIDITVDDVIRAEGPRMPAREACHWKAAFVIVHDPASPPTATQIARVDAYRRRWESFYADATDQRGSMDTSLAGTGAGTTGCPATMVPPGDAGVVVYPDAAVSPDSGIVVNPDATVETHEDAASVAPDAAEHPEPDDAGEPVDLGTQRAQEPKVIGLGEDCGCTNASGGSARDPSASLSVLFGLFVLARARVRTVKTSRS